MTARPCNDHITGCPCTSDDPFANLSSEAPDPIDVIRMAWTADAPRSNSPENYWNVPIGVGACSAADAQTAQDCARKAAVVDGHPDQTTYGNATTLCTVPCPDGSLFSFAVSPNTFLADSQAEADAVAASYCRYRAQQARICAPIVITAAASNVSGSNARMNGTVNPNGASTSVFFEWGLTTAYGHITPVTAVGFGNTTLPFLADVTGLPSGTIHYRIVGISAQGTSYGSDVSFSTVTLVPPLEWWTFDEAIPANGAIHATVMNLGAPVAPGKIANGIRMVDGQFYQVNAFPNAINGVNSSTFNVTLWARWNAYSVAENANFNIASVSLYDNAGGSAGGMLFRWFSGSQRFQLRIFDEFGFFQVTQNFTAGSFLPVIGQWYMFTVCYDVATGLGTIYVAGGSTFVTVGSYSQTVPPTSAIVSGVLNAGVPTFAGDITIDELAFFNYNLTPAEQVLLYNGGTGKTWPL